MTDREFEFPQTENRRTDRESGRAGSTGEDQSSDGSGTARRTAETMWRVTTYPLRAPIRVNTRMARAVVNSRSSDALLDETKDIARDELEHLGLRDTDRERNSRSDRGRGSHRREDFSTDGKGRMSGKEDKRSDREFTRDDSEQLEDRSSDESETVRRVAKTMWRVTTYPVRAPIRVNTRLARAVANSRSPDALLDETKNIARDELEHLGFRDSDADHERAGRRADRSRSRDRRGGESATDGGDLLTVEPEDSRAERESVPEDTVNVETGIDTVDANETGIDRGESDSSTDRRQRRRPSQNRDGFESDADEADSSRFESDSAREAKTANRSESKRTVDERSAGSDRSRLGEGVSSLSRTGLSNAVDIARNTANATREVTEYSMRAQFRTTRRLASAAASARSPDDLIHESRDIVFEEVKHLGVDVERSLASRVEGGRAGEAVDTETAKELLQNRGARILRDSADIEYEEPVHPGYARILDELSTDEARILRLLAIEGSKPSISIYASGLLPGTELVARNITMVGLEAGCRYNERTHSYLNNLERLGLVRLSDQSVSDPKAYQIMEAQPAAEEALREAGHLPKITYGSVHLAPFGIDFCRMCLPVDVDAEKTEGALVSEAIDKREEADDAE